MGKQNERKMTIYIHLNALKGTVSHPIGAPTTSLASGVGALQGAARLPASPLKLKRGPSASHLDKEAELNCCLAVLAILRIYVVCR